MSEPIKPGDLVMVVRVCCQALEDKLGQIRIVADVLPDVETTCRHCRTSNKGWHVASTVSLPWGAPYWWYKKIPPLSDLEGQKDSSGLDERHEFYEALRKMAEGLRS